MEQLQVPKAGSAKLLFNGFHAFHMIRQNVLHHFVVKKIIAEVMWSIET
jgi:hypothetical protein